MRRKNLLKRKATTVSLTTALSSSFDINGSSISISNSIRKACGGIFSNSLSITYSWFNSASIVRPESIK